MRRLPRPAVVMGVREMGGDSVMREILQRLSRIEGKIDNYSDMAKQVNCNTTDIATIRKDVVDHERRIGGIESWGKWLVAGVGIALLQAILQIVMR